MSETVRFESRGRIAIVTIDRPERRNAVDRPTAAALAAAFRQFDADPELDVAILTGAGECFCAGADLRAISEGKPNRIEDDGDGPMGPTRMLLSKPVIAAIEGWAVAGGLELAIWCDLRVAARDAVLGVLCRRWGVPLVDGGTVRLPRLIGQSRALDLIMTGREVGGEEALGMGLVNRLCERGEALRRAIELAEGLVSLPQACMREDRLSCHEQGGWAWRRRWGMSFGGGGGSWRGRTSWREWGNSLHGGTGDRPFELGPGSGGDPGSDVVLALTSMARPWILGGVDEERDDEIAVREAGDRQPDRYESEYMRGEGVVLYRDKSRAPWPLHAMFGAIAVFLVGSAVAVPGGWIGALVSLPIFLAMWLMFSVLRVSVSEGHVNVQYGLFGPKIPIAAIESSEAVTYDWKKFGGWGIRLNRDGEWIYNMPGDGGRAVRVVWRDRKGRRKVTLIGSLQSELLAQQIQRAQAALPEATTPGALPPAT